MEIELRGVPAVLERLKVVFDEYDREAYNIFKAYAAEAMVYFMEVQGSAGKEQRGMFWTNHTFMAVQGWFAYAWQIPTGPSMGITFANSTWYAEILENGHGGRFASFPTMIERFYPMIIHDLKVLYGEI